MLSPFFFFFSVCLFLLSSQSGNCRGREIGLLVFNIIGLGCSVHNTLLPGLGPLLWWSGWELCKYVFSPGKQCTFEGLNSRHKRLDHLGMISATDWLFLPPSLDNGVVLNNAGQPHDESCHFQPRTSSSCEQLFHQHGSNDGSYLSQSRWNSGNCSAQRPSVYSVCSEWIPLMLSMPPVTHLPHPQEDSTPQGWGIHGGSCRGKPCRDPVKRGSETQHRKDRSGVLVLGHSQYG